MPATLTAHEFQSTVTSPEPSDITITITFEGGLTKPRWPGIVKNIYEDVPGLEDALTLAPVFTRWDDQKGKALTFDIEVKGESVVPENASRASEGIKPLVTLVHSTGPGTPIDFGDLNKNRNQFSITWRDIPALKDTEMPFRWLYCFYVDSEENPVYLPFVYMPPGVLSTILEGLMGQSSTLSSEEATTSFLPPLTASEFPTSHENGGLFTVGTEIKLDTNGHPIFSDFFEKNEQARRICDFHFAPMFWVKKKQTPIAFQFFSKSEEDIFCPADPTPINPGPGIPGFKPLALSWYGVSHRKDVPFEPAKSGPENPPEIPIGFFNTWTARFIVHACGVLWQEPVPRNEGRVASFLFGVKRTDGRVSLIDPTIVDREPP